MNNTNLEKFFDNRLAEIEKTQLRNAKGLGLHIKYVPVRNKDDTHTIYSRLTYKGKTAEISTGIRCQKADFQRKPLSIKDNEKQTQLLQFHDADIMQVFTDFKLSRREFEVSDIKNFIIGINKDETPSILGAFDLFTKHLDLHANTDSHTIGSKRKMKAWNKRLIEFLRERHGRNGKLDKIQPYEIEAYKGWLMTKKEFKNNSAEGRLGHFIRFMNFCLSNTWIPSNPFLMYKRKFEKTDIKYLTVEEMTLLEETPIHSKALDRVRDGFLLMFYTGMNYADLSTLTRANLYSKGSNSYIIKARTKTDIPQITSLTEKTLNLIEKYKNDKECIKENRFVPVCTNEVMNRYLKQVAEICNIDKPLSTKYARASKATHFWGSGENLELIQMIMGHRVGSSVTHKHYIDHNPELLISRLERLSLNNKI